MESLGIQFAPLNVPLKRRVQTVAAAVWITTSLCGGLCCLWLVAYLILFTNYWPLGLLYLMWAYHDSETPSQGGRKLWFVRSLPIWKYFVDYFPIKLIKTIDLTPDKNYLFCSYPHGVLCAGIFGNFATNYSDAAKLFPGFNVSCSTLDLHFRAPLFRDFLMGLGAVSSSKDSLVNAMESEEKGKIVVLIVGGASESLFAKPGSYHIILKKRKGFVKIALYTGCSLVPIFSFGEIDLYDQVSNPPGSKLYRLQEWIKAKTGIAAVMPVGRGFFQYSYGFIPRRSAITTVVGEPIDVPKIMNPTDEAIEHYHSLFTKKLIELFNEHKAKYLPNSEKIELIID